MITIKLKGGLGNQMFQYATGRKLAIKNNTELYLNTSYYSSKRAKDTLRYFELQNFNIDLKIKNKDNFLLKFYKKIFKKYYFDYHPELFKKISKKLSNNPNTKIYLEGFFQSEKNFAEIRPLLLQELELKPEFVTEKLKDFERQISEKNSVPNSAAVSIHIRRGDYANNPETLKYHGLCPISYYKKAIEKISEAVENIHFFVFTDDPKWVEKNLDISYNNTFVSGNGLSGPQEIHLMSKCNHNIIANSTFSWWGAWLNQNPDKIVIAPKKWTIKNTEHPNIIPDGWIKI